MKNILVVDDNQSDLVITKTVVVKSGNQPIACEDAYQALEYIGSYPIDLIIVDWSMPKMNGLEFIRRIKTQIQKSKIPVMFITGKNEAKDVKAAIQVGASDYLIKPINPQTLEEKIRKIFAMKEPGAA